METFEQPKITGYRKLSEEEVALMNEGKELAQRVGEFIDKLRRYPASAPQGPEMLVAIGKDGQPVHYPTLDQRWVSIGATQLQQGFMAVVRGIAQPSTF